MLVLTRTEGFRHPSIEQARAFFRSEGRAGVIDATLTEDTDRFTEDGLDQFDVVVFANTTGDVLDADEQRALRSWVEAGGGFVGVHAAADTEHDWPWYGDLVGAHFESHPLGLQEVTLTVEDPDHPATAHLPAELTFLDEHYNYDRHPRTGADVLVTLDEETAVHPDGAPVDGFTHGADHPVAWTSQAGLGRSFYTNLGHEPQTWEDPAFQDHLRGGLEWTLETGRWRRSVITEEIDQAVALRVAESGHVFWIERRGLVLLWDPATGGVRTVGELDVELEGEGGLIGLEPAPDVADSGDVYLYWTRSSPDGPGIENVLGRFTLDGDCTIDPGEPDELLTVPNDGPSHQAGELRFHPDGSLLVATGDNTANLDDGYAPIDDRPGREEWDARRTSGDPTDRRGAILRVDVEDGLADPEVLVTGVRNPYRLAIEPDTGAIWWGDIGPDAVFDGERGPRGYDELNRVTGPADGGWPFCVADLAYREWDAAAGKVGDEFDCSDTVEPRLAYDYTSLIDPDLGTAARPAVGDDPGELTGRAIMVGPFITDDAGPYAPPVDGLILHEFARHLLLAAELDGDAEIVDLDALAPWMGIDAPVDVELAPDGALYVLEFGRRDSDGGKALSRIEYSESGTFPVLPTTAALPPGAALPVDGDGLYQLHCAACHGANGEGGRGPSLIDVANRLSEDEHRVVVQAGRDQMPPFGGILTDEEIDLIIEHERNGFG